MRSSLYAQLLSVSVASAFDSLLYREIFTDEIAFTATQTNKADSEAECSLLCTSKDRQGVVVCKAFRFSSNDCILGSLNRNNPIPGSVKTHVAMYPVSSSLTKDLLVAVVNTPYVPADAGMACQLLGGRLFEPRSDEELQWLKTFDVEHPGVTFNFVFTIGVKRGPNDQPVFWSNDQAIDSAIAFTDLQGGRDCYTANAQGATVFLKTFFCDATGYARYACEFSP